MRKTTKSLASLLLVMAMVFTMIPASLFTASAAEHVLSFYAIDGSGDFTFTGVENGKTFGNNLLRAGFQNGSKGTSNESFSFKAGEQYTFKIVGGVSEWNTSWKIANIYINDSKVGDFGQIGSLSYSSVYGCQGFEKTFTYTATADVTAPVVVEFKGDKDKQGYATLTISGEFGAGGQSTDTDPTTDTTTDTTADTPVGGTVTIASGNIIQDNWSQKVTVDLTGYSSATLTISDKTSGYSYLKAAVGSWNTPLFQEADKGETVVDLTDYCGQEITLIFGANGARTYTITGTLAPVADEYTVTMGTISNGTVTVDDATASSGDTFVVANGDSITLVATANAGYTFAGWSTNGGSSYVSTNATWTYTPNADVTITPVFEVEKLTITLNSADYASAYNYYYNDNAGKCYAVPFDFTSGLGDVKVEIISGRGYTNVFGPDGMDVTNLTTTSNSKSGTITSSVAADQAYGNGVTEFTINSESPSGRYFVAVSNSNNVTIKLTYPDGSIATLPLTTDYTVTVETVTGGTATVNGGSSATVEEGESVSLTATAFEGYTFKGWQIGDDTITDATYTYTPDADITITPIFTPNKVTVSVIADNGTVTGAGSYDYGTQATLKVTADDGYRFTGWYVAGECVSTSTTYTFDVPLTDVTVTAAFEEIVTYTVTVESANTAQGAVTGGGTYESGTQATVIATAKTGYAFKGWYVNGLEVSNNASYTFDVTGDITLTAEFEEATTTDTIRIEAESADINMGTTYDGGYWQVKTEPDGNFGAATNGEWLQIRGDSGRGEVYLPITIPESADGVTYTIKLVAGTSGDNRKVVVNLWKAGTGDETISLNGSDYYKYEDSELSTETKKTFSDDAFVAFENISLEAGTYYVGLYGENWAGFDYIEIVASEPVFEYVAPSYTVNATVDGNGTVAVTPEQDTFEQGSTVTVTVTPVEGYSVAYWTVNGTQVSSTSNTYTIEAIDRNYTIEAKLTNTYKVTTTVKAADKEHPYAFAEIVLPESVFPQLYVEENWKNGFNITCSYNLTDYIFNGKAEAVFAVKTSSGKYYYQQSTHNLANTTITIPNCWYDPDDEVVSVILLVTAIAPAQNDFLENGDALVDLRMDFTVFDVETRDTPYVDLKNKTDNYIIYGNEIPVMNSSKPSDWQNNNGDSWVTFETVIDDLNEFEHRVWEIEYEFDRSNEDWDAGGTTGGVYAGRYYIVPDGDVHVDATGGSGFSFYYRTEVSNTEGIWITLQSNLFSTHEADDEGREPMKVYLEPTGGEWEACFVAYDLSRADGEYITYWDFFVDGSNSCVESNGTYTYVDPKVYGDDYITKMSADAGTFWFTELRLERYSNIIIEYKDMFGKVIEHRTDKVATIQDPPDFIERKGYDFLYWTYNGKIVGEYWTDDATGEYVTPGTEGATKYDTGHFELPVTESRIYVAVYQYNGELYNITVTNGAITNVSTKPVEEDQCRYETVLLLEASKETSADFAYWVYGDYDVDEEGNKIAGTEKYSILSYKESFYTSVMGHADYIAVYQDDIEAGAEFVPPYLLAYYSPDKTGNGATYYTSAADMKLYTSIFNRAEVFDSYHDREHNKISFLGTIAYDEDVYNPIGWGTVVTNNEDAADTVGGADTLLDGGKTSDEMVISYENFLSATWYWTNVGTSGATIQKTSWTRTDVWDVILAGGQYLMSYTNLNNGSVRYARTFLVAEEIATGAVYMVYSDEQTKGEISAQPETVDINVTIKIDGVAVETTTDGRVVTAVDSGCYTTGSGSVITTVDGFVRATPAVGYNFLGWDVGGDGTIDETSTKYEYSKLTANVDLVALFEKTDTFYVTATVATANAGRIASSVTNNQITAGTSVTIYALPNSGFKFLGWYVSDKDVGISYVPTTFTSTDASYTFTPEEDCYAYAYFVESSNVKTYTVTIGEAEGGSATVDGETSTSVEYGTKVTLVATPDVGYEFAYWIINSVNGSTESTIEYAVSKNVTITPVFHQSTYGYTDTLTLEAEDYTDAQYVLSGGAVSTGTDGDITYSIIDNDGKDVQVIPFTAPADGKYTITYYYQRQSGSEIHFDIFTTSSSDLAQMTIDGVTYYETYYNGKYSNIGEATDDYDSVSSGTWGVKEFPMTLELSAGETILIGLCDNNGNAYFDKVVVTADAEVFEEGVKPTVTIVATNGTVTDADGATVETGKYSVGTELTLYPVQNSADYIFSHWADAAGNELSTDVCYTFTVEADTTVEAVFEAYTAINHTKTPAEETVYNVTVGVQNGNTVIVKNYFTGDKDNNLANYEGYYLDTITSENVTFTVVDRKLTLTAVDKVVADGEYNIFLGWKVNGVLQSGTTDEDGNHEFKTEKVSKYDSLEIIAVYSAEALAEHTITVESANGSVLDADDNVVSSVTGYVGSSATLFAAPEVGYIFSHWELDGVNVGLDIPYIATIVDDATLVAVFDEYESIETNPNAHVNKDANQSYYNLTVSVENGNSAVVKNYYSTSAEGYYLDTITSATGTVVEVPADRKVTLTAVDKVVNGNEVNIFVGWYQDGVLLSTDRVCQVAKRSTATTVVAKYSTVTSLDVTINYLGASEITYNGSEYTSFTIDAPVNGTTYTFTVGDAANYYEFLGWYAGETLLGTDKTLNYTYDASNGSVEIVAKFDFVSVDTMPIISISTSNQDVTNADPQNSGFNAITEDYVDATVSVLNGDAYSSYSLTDATAEVKGRGNSTWSSAENNNLKRPIRIKFAKKEKQDLLNLNGAELRNWVLLANNIDRSMYRNALAFELGNALDGIAYTSKWSNVEVYINGVYQGVYLLCEQSEADPDRNAIAEPEDDSQTQVDAFLELDNKQNHKNNGETPDVVFDAPYDDGDYYFEADKSGTYSFTTYQDPVFTIKSDLFSLDQYNYVKNTVKAAQNTIYNGSESEIRAAINVDSFVDMYILQEIAKNIDVGYSSFYMMLKDGVVYLTNPWDFDKAFGDDDRADSTTGLYVGEKEGADDSRNYNPWFVALLDKSWFKDLVKARWTELYDAGTFTTVAETISADFDAKEDSLNRNWAMWADKMDDKLDNEPSAVLNYSSHKQAFDGLISWYEARIAYINSQYNTNGGSTGGETPDGETVEIYAIVDGNINATHINGTATPDSLATDDDIINAGKSGGENRIGYGIAIEIPELADGQVVTVDLYARGKADWGAYYLVWASNDSSNEYKGATGTGKADDNWSEDNWNLTKTDVATTITFDSNTPAGTYYVGILANYMNFYKVVVNYPSAN